MAERRMPYSGELRISMTVRLPAMARSSSDSLLRIWNAAPVNSSHSPRDASPTPSNSRSAAARSCLLGSLEN